MNEDIHIATNCKPEQTASIIAGIKDGLTNRGFECKYINTANRPPSHVSVRLFFAPPATSMTPDERKEAIAQTTKEIVRLGWSNEQGRNYLLAHYNKRARSQLTDKELSDFLKFLQKAP